MEHTTFEQAVEVVSALLPEDKERLCEWLDEQRKKNGHQQQEHKEETKEDRLKRIEETHRKIRAWMNENRHKYVGEWVGLDGDRLIAHDKDGDKVREKLKAAEIKSPFFGFIEDDDIPFAGW